MPEQTLEQQLAENAPAVQTQPTLTPAPPGGVTVPPPTTPAPAPGALPEPLPTRPGFLLPGEEDRLNLLIGQNRHLWPQGMWSHEFNVWLLAIPDDPTDIGFSIQLKEMQAKARKAEAEIEKQRKADEEELRRMRGRAAMAGPPTMVQPETPTPEGAPTLPAAIPGKPPTAPEEKPLKPGEMPKGLTEAEQIQWEKEHGIKRARYEAQTMFRGAPVDEQALFGEGVTPQMLEQEFARVNGSVDEGPGAAVKKRSGAYVYTGQEVDPETGAKRDVYVYVEDAQAGLYSLGPERIKHYQSMVGAPATGIPDDKTDGLEQEWNAAVRIAQGMAKAGIKMSVQEIFDSRMAQRQKAYLASRSGGGGGGGGLGGLEEDPEDRAAVDYYRAMQQVLGDISGVSA